MLSTLISTHRGGEKPLPIVKLTEVSTNAYTIYHNVYDAPIHVCKCIIDNKVVGIDTIFK